jgi:hypothetical protein
MIQKRTFPQHLRKSTPGSLLTSCNQRFPSWYTSRSATGRYEFHTGPSVLGAFEKLQKAAVSFAYLSVRPSVRPSVCLSVRPSVCLSVRPSVCLSVRPSVCPSVRLSVCLSVRPSVRLSVRLSVRPSVRLSVCLSAWNNSATTGRILMKFDI